MKSICLIATCIFTLCSGLGYSQAEEVRNEGTSFYQRMALSDAQMEESLSFDSPEDEADYWDDQLNFEKLLKERAYSSYKAYIFYKSQAYLAHQAECDIAANHGRGYNRQAHFYGTQGMEGGNAAGDSSVSIKPLSAAFLRY